MPKCDDPSQEEDIEGYLLFSTIENNFLVLSKGSSVSPIWKKIKKTGSSHQIHNFKDILFQIRWNVTGGK